MSQREKDRGNIPRNSNGGHHFLRSRQFKDLEEQHKTTGVVGGGGVGILNTTPRSNTGSNAWTERT